MKFCLAIDLKDDPFSIAEYERWHYPENTWSEVNESITKAGIRQMEIYRTGNRLFMIMETEENFSFERKANLDVANAKVQLWEQLMDSFQLRLPWSKDGEKWTVMNRIFQLADSNENHR